MNNGAAVGPQGEGMESPSTFPAYPEYRDSGVEWLGEVPQHWYSARFSRVVMAIRDGTHGTFERVVTGVPLLSAKNVQNGFLDISEGESLISEADSKRIVSNGFPAVGDLLLTIVGTIGRSCVYTAEQSLAFQRSVCFLRLHKRHCPYFFYYLSQSKFFQEQLVGRSKSSAQAGVYMGEVVATSVVFPPNLSEQTQIARFLEHETARIDALIEEQQRLIELLKEKRQAVISHAVTKGLDPTVPMKDSGVEWLGEVPAHWHVGALKHFISPVPGAIKTGPFGSHLKSEDMKEGPYKVFNQRSVIDADFSAGDNFISEEKFGELRGFTAFPGDVLVTTRGTIGRAAILPDNAEVGILHPCLLRIQVEKSKITSSYLCRLIQESHLLKTQLSLMSNSTTIEVIYSETMANLFIPVPPITEQGQIAGFLDDVIRKFSALTSDANESVRLLQERRSALISAAVTGKIDVRGWQPPASAPTPELVEEAV